jgi:hypothetical protein
MCLTLSSLALNDVYAGGTATATIEPSVFDITYTPGRALKGSTVFTPSVWHQDNPSGPFGTCEKHPRVNIHVSKLIYPYRLLTDKDWYPASYYDIGTSKKVSVERGVVDSYKGLCIFNPTDMKLWDYKFDPFPNSILTVSEAANFCSRAENQGRKHVIAKTVKATIPNITGSASIHSVDQAVTINLSCDCNPLSLSDSVSGVIYRTDNQAIKHNLLNIGSKTAVLPITTTLVSGQLPAGLSMKLEADSSVLYLEGIPATEGDYRFSVKTKDSCPLERSDTIDFNVSVRCGTMKFATPQQLPDATLKKPYKANILTTCNGQYENLRYELLGELPAGLSMSNSGQITGTPVEEKAAYFFVSVTGQEKGLSKEIHQRFDLNVVREIQIMPGGPRPDMTDGNTSNPLMTGSPEVIGVPSTCDSEEPMTISYKGLSPHPGSKIGLFGEKERGTNPALGWKAATGASGTLTFNAPVKSGRYLFKIFDRTGNIVVKSSIFTVNKTIATTSTATDNPMSVKPSITSGAVKPHGGLMERRPAVNCADTLLFNGLQGYKIDNCVKRFDEARVFFTEEPDSGANPRFEGEKTTVIYEWPSGTPSPSIIQVKRYFAQEAKRLGGAVIVDRPNYSAFEITRSGNTVYVSIDVYNDGQTVNFMAIEPEVKN